MAYNPGSLFNDLTASVTGPLTQVANQAVTVAGEAVGALSGALSWAGSAATLQGAVQEAATPLSQGALPGTTPAPGLGSVGSLWDGIHPTLIAILSVCDHTGAPRVGTVPVRGLLVEDANLEFTLNWQSPFEGAGPETRAPTLTAMLQSGALQPIAERLSADVGAATKELTDTARGRTGMTKLNSTQVFSSMPPMRLQVTFLLRAWSDPQREVEAPLDRLMALSLPQYLAPEGTMITAAVDWFRGDQHTVGSLVESALPSKSPPMVSLTYKGRTFAPLVIESIGVPLNAPSDRYGRFVQIQLPVTLASLTAMDGADWAATKRGFT